MEPGEDKSDFFTFSPLVKGNQNLKPGKPTLADAVEVVGKMSGLGS